MRHIELEVKIDNVIKHRKSFKEIASMTFLQWMSHVESLQNITADIMMPLSCDRDDIKLALALTDAIRSILTDYKIIAEAQKAGVDTVFGYVKSIAKGNGKNAEERKMNSLKACTQYQLPGRTHNEMMLTEHGHDEKVTVNFINQQTNCNRQKVIIDAMLRQIDKKQDALKSAIFLHTNKDFE